MNPSSNLIPSMGFGRSRLSVRPLWSLPDHFPRALPALAEEKLDVGALVQQRFVAGGLWPPRTAPLLSPRLCLCFATVLVSFLVGDECMQPTEMV